VSDDFRTTTERNARSSPISARTGPRSRHPTRYSESPAGRLPAPCSQAQPLEVAGAGDFHRARPAAPNLTRKSHAQRRSSTERRTVRECWAGSRRTSAEPGSGHWFAVRHPLPAFSAFSLGECMCNCFHASMNKVMTTYPAPSLQYPIVPQNLGSFKG